MDPTIIDLLTASDDNDLRAKAQILAQSLRGGRDIGMMALGGGKLAAPYGKQLLSEADAGERQMLAAGIANQRTGQEALDRKATLADLANKRAYEIQRMKGEQGMEMARLKALAGLAPKPSKPLPGKEADTLAELDSTVKSIANVRDRFQAKYAGQGPLGRAANWVGGALGTWGPKSVQEQNDFWANFKMLVELPTRHKFFGSALTPTEAVSWKEAQNITPGTDPEIVQRKFEEMLNVAQSKLDTRATSRTKEGVYSPDAIQAIAPHANTSGRTVVRRGRDKATGKRVVQYSDGTVEAE